MNVLVANDDGYTSEGLNVLVKKLSEKHNVYVVAPDSNRSAVSHHITIFNDNELKKISDKVYACSGYPADCSAIGIMSNLFDFKFDVVVSGINHGGNLGTDIVYSGTCGAARQAVFNGVPGIAVSIEPYDWKTVHETGFKFEALADFVAKNLEELVKLSSTTTPRTFVNINGAPEDSYKGVKISKKLCEREYHDNLKIIEEQGKLISKFDPGFGSNVMNDSEYDYTIVHDGYICVSVVYAEPLCTDLNKDVNLVL